MDRNEQRIASSVLYTMIAAVLILIQVPASADLLQLVPIVFR